MLTAHSAFRSSNRIRSAAAAARCLLFSVGSTTDFSASSSACASTPRCSDRDLFGLATRFRRIRRSFLESPAKFCARDLRRIFRLLHVIANLLGGPLRRVAQDGSAASALQAPVATPGGSPGPRPRQHLRSPLSRRAAPVRPNPAVARLSMGRSAMFRNRGAMGSSWCLVVGVRRSSVFGDARSRRRSGNRFTSSRRPRDQLGAAGATATSVPAQASTAVSDEEASARSPTSRTGTFAFRTTHSASLPMTSRSPP